MSVTGCQLDSKSMICEHTPQDSSSKGQGYKLEKRGMLGKKIYFLKKMGRSGVGRPETGNYFGAVLAHLF